MNRLFQFKTLQGKIFFYFLTISLFVLFIAFATLYIQISKDIRIQETNKLETIRNLKVDNLLDWLEERKGDIRVIANDHDIRAMEYFFSEENSSTEDISISTDNARQHLLRYLQNFPDYQQLLIIHPQTERIILSTIKDREGEIVSDHNYFRQSAQSENISIQPIHYSDYFKNNTLDFSMPIFCLEHNGEHVIGILIARIDPEVSLYPLLSDTTGLGETGETVIANREGIVQNPLRWQPESNQRLKIAALPIQRAIQGLTGVVQAKDYRGEEVIAAYTFLPELDWGFSIKQDVKEIYGSTKYLLINLTILFFCPYSFNILGYQGFCPVNYQANKRDE